MNKNKIWSLTLFLSLVLAGCSDQFLEDKKNFDSFDESIFTNETQTSWYIDRIYYDFFAGYNSPIKTLVGSYSDDKSRMTEEIGGTINNLINPGKTLETSADCPTYFGAQLVANPQNHPYTRIRNCNILIEKMDVVGASLPETFRNNAKGQMYFFRALQYFDLVRTYGGVPIVTEVLNASSTDESIKYPRATTSECIAQIIKDLDKAAELLPTEWVASSGYGRFNKAAALAMKSRVLLTHASPLFNTDWDNAGNQRWQLALEAGLAAEKELSSMGYGLYGNSAKDWQNMFLIDNKFCSEVIMVQMCSPATSAAINNGWEKSIRLSSQSGSGGVPAPKEMIDLFPLENGVRPTKSNGYDETNFYLNRDPRFYRTFAFSGCKWGHKTNANVVVWAYRYKKADNKTIVYADGNQLKSPAFVRKMSNPVADDNSFEYSGTDIFEYRYAELLLNIAECYAAKGDIANCTAYLGKIRKRVGIASANNYGIGTLADKYAAIEACLYERRIELAYEGKRFWDVQRWMLYNDDASVNNNTCAKLGIKPINGTTRTGNHWQAIATGNTDPIASIRGTISIDPDASNFKDQLNALAKFYADNFTLVSPETAMDVDGKNPVNILWRQNYYVFGLHTTVLTNNSWLEQTTGWKDPFGAMGTYNFQK
ncbi:RagB/SusD family nutrient uptake outer membrane protein [Dysgonomonas sp. HDW5B]|uniref:RagB/SusD family nutrient uptake outer membrane protein n=1 Tax=Dysgonomonas sp. HDW5B TaxID=2714927 RepID=UPI001408228D|nr:RagB/SusD family nutrient uptake outer membrane protein [Dysgonomonas sp. HDW5B]QIK55694.1 RagB/SusD family nutrient uptake outer membrane protein [Dysgonomonas sp. HDW5B]